MIMLNALKKYKDISELSDEGISNSHDKRFVCFHFWLDEYPTIPNRSRRKIFGERVMKVKVRTLKDIQQFLFKYVDDNGCINLDHEQTAVVLTAIAELLNQLPRVVNHEKDLTAWKTWVE